MFSSSFTQLMSNCNKHEIKEQFKTRGYEFFLFAVTEKIRDKNHQIDIFGTQKNLNCNTYILPLECHCLITNGLTKLRSVWPCASASSLSFFSRNVKFPGPYWLKVLWVCSTRVNNVLITPKDSNVSIVPLWAVLAPFLSWSRFKMNLGDGKDQGAEIPGPNSLRIQSLGELCIEGRPRVLEI